MSETYHYVESLAGLLPEMPAESIISRSVHGDEVLNVTLFGFAAGQELTEHTAAFPAVLHFLEGEFELRLGDAHFEARPGAWAYMPAHLPHSLKAATGGSLLLILVKQGS